jgi:hypothetical protein
MSSLPIEGTISAKPFAPLRQGTIDGSPPPVSGRISGGSADSPQSAAIAELGTLISSLGSLSAQAQSLPLSPPSLPGLPQGGYQPASTDYTQFCDDANS